MKVSQLLCSSLLSFMLIGCAGERDYEPVARDGREFQVADLKTEGRWFYVPTTGAAPRFALNQFPFLQGFERYVELCFGERGLEVRNVDLNKPQNTLPKDENGFCIGESLQSVANGRQSNFSHVLTIPGKYYSYRCREDRYGDCTNEEEINTDADVDLNDNTHFTPKLEQVEISEYNWPDFIGVTQGVTEQGEPVLISAELNPVDGVINFELERTYRVDADAVSSYIAWGNRAGFEDGSKDGAFKARFYFSLVHESLLVSPEYRSVQHPPGDGSRFGFLTSARKVLNSTTNLYDENVRLLNRFNTELGSIPYYLTDNFFEPENNLALTTVIESVRNLNHSLLSSGDIDNLPRIEIVNPQHAMQIHPGDLRYNVINIVQEPMPRGVLGVGPIVAHPLTGEIVKAQTTLYVGEMRTKTPGYWDGLVRLYDRQDLTVAEDEIVTAIQENRPQGVSGRMSFQRYRSAGASVFAANRLVNQPINDATLPAQRDAVSFPQPVRQLSPANRFDLASDDRAPFKDIVEVAQHRLDLWSQNHAYPADTSLWVSSTSKSVLSTLDLNDSGYFQRVSENTDTAESPQLLTFYQLPSRLRQRVSDAITMAQLTATLVHELGHNLGLMHNFKGSNDSGNFHTPELASSLGLSAVPAYSSVMDYPASVLDHLPVWGPYDIAALRYGYQRQIDMQTTTSNSPSIDAGLVPCRRLVGNVSNDASNTSQNSSNIYRCNLDAFDSALQNGSDKDSTQFGAFQYLDIASAVSTLNPVPFAYCSDSHVPLAADCNRYDEGSNREEIVSFEWQRYIDGYQATHGARYQPSGVYLQDYSTHLVRRYTEMSSIRDKLEDMELVDAAIRRFGVGSDADKPGDVIALLTETTCASAAANNPWYCEYGLSVKKAAGFFLDVLRTPEHQCLLQNNIGNLQRMISLGATLDALAMQLPAEYDVVNASCFDLPAITTIATLYPDHTVLAETRNGVFLNSVGSNNPDYPWANAVSVLGMWPDKALASYFVAKRFSSRDSEDISAVSLLDWPGVKDEFNVIIANLLAQEPLGESIELIDASGEAFVPDPALQVNLHISSLIEALPLMPAGFSEFLSLPSSGSLSASQLILTMAVKAMKTDDFQLARRGRVQYQSYTKQLYNRTISGNEKNMEFTLDGVRYVATTANALAHRYAKQLLSGEGYPLQTLFSGYTTEALTSLVEEILIAWGVAFSLPPEHRRPVEILDAPLVEDMADFLQSSGSGFDSQELVLLAWQEFAETRIASNVLSVSADNSTMQYGDGRDIPFTEVFAAFLSLVEQIPHSEIMEALMLAVRRVFDGYQAASETDREVWANRVEHAIAWRNGSFELVVGDSYKILDQIPVAEQ